MTKRPSRPVGTSLGLPPRIWRRSRLPAIQARPCADIYAIGASSKKLLTGASPFAGKGRPADAGGAVLRAACALGDKRPEDAARGCRFLCCDASGRRIVYSGAPGSGKKFSPRSMASPSAKTPSPKPQLPKEAPPVMFGVGSRCFCRRGIGLRSGFPKEPWRQRTNRRHTRSRPFEAARPEPWYMRKGLASAVAQSRRRRRHAHGGAERGDQARGKGGLGATEAAGFASASARRSLCMARSSPRDRNR